MSDTSRQPRAFPADDPALVLETPPPDAAETGSSPEATRPGAREGGASSLRELGQRGWRWGMLLVGALAGAASLSMVAWLSGFVATALARDDWIGWSTLALLLVAAFAAVMIVLRELIGLARVSHLKHLKADIAEAIADGDRKRERRAAQRVVNLYAGRPALAWSLRRFREHVGDVHDPGELMALAEREIMLPLDAEARRMVTRSAKRVATVTTLSPMAAIAVGYVMIENLRLLRALATLYGARPGFGGMMQLARMVFTHIVATGGVAMTDDLLGQFLGQDLIHRLSRRLGEGAFNGALTARVGMTALEVIRPMPFRIGRPPRVRDVLAEVLKPIVGRKRDASA